MDQQKTVNSKVIWVVGSDTAIGDEVIRILKASWTRTFISDASTDISSYDAVDNVISDMHDKGYDVEWIINCSEHRPIDKSEDEVRSTTKANVCGAMNLAVAASLIGAKMIHFSTDNVFDGEKTPKDGYAPHDSCNPQNFYGMSKYMGELAVTATVRKLFLIRVGIVFGTHGKDLISMFLTDTDRNEAVEIASDKFGSISYVRDIGKLVVEIVSRDSSEYGTYHFACKGRMSWFDLLSKATDIASEFDWFDGVCELEKGILGESDVLGFVPNDVHMDVSLAEKTFGVELVDWEEVLEEYLFDLDKFYKKKEGA